MDTVSVIDLEATPPRVIDRVMVGDAPEGLAIRPKGDLAAMMMLRGNDAAVFCREQVSLSHWDDAFVNQWPR